MNFGEPKIGSSSKFKEARVQSEGSDDGDSDSWISKTELLDEAKAKMEKLKVRLLYGISGRKKTRVARK